MFENITHQYGVVLDEIVRARHSVRAFSSICPSREDVEAIIQTGLLAPFGAFAVAGQSDFRKVFILTQSTVEIEDAKNILKSRIAHQANELEKKVGSVPFVQN